MRGATQLITMLVSNAEFQSTRPMRGATEYVQEKLHGRLSFNPRAPCGARLAAFIQVVFFLFVSIHAPHAGRDTLPRIVALTGIVFQSTRPMRGATRQHGGGELYERFQSTRPMRGATADLEASRSDMEFQSTRPMRGATYLHNPSTGNVMTVSIHAPHAGRDL